MVPSDLEPRPAGWSPRLKPGVSRWNRLRLRGHQVYPLSGSRSRISNRRTGASKRTSDYLSTGYSAGVVRDLVAPDGIHVHLAGTIPSSLASGLTFRRARRWAKPPFWPLAVRLPWLSPSGSATCKISPAETPVLICGENRQIASSACKCRSVTSRHRIATWKSGPRFLLQYSGPEPAKSSPRAFQPCSSGAREPHQARDVQGLLPCHRDCISRSHRQTVDRRLRC